MSGFSHKRSFYTQRFIDNITNDNMFIWHSQSIWSSIAEQHIHWEIHTNDRLENVYYKRHLDVCVWWTKVRQPASIVSTYFDKSPIPNKRRRHCDECVPCLAYACIGHAHKLKKPATWQLWWPSNLCQVWYAYCLFINYLLLSNNTLFIRYTVQRGQP